MDFYPNNTLSHYITKLPQQFDLTGQWELGLYEIQFPVTWPTITEEDESKLYVLVWRGEKEGHYVDGDYVDVSPPPGHYSSPDQLVKQINAKIERVEHRKGGTRFHYNEISRKISIRFDDKSIAEAVVKMSKTLAELLGFDWTNTPKPWPDNDDDARKKRSEHYRIDDYQDYEIPVDSSNKDMLRLQPEIARSYTASRVCDLQRGFYSLYVYCNIVEHVVVGDAKVPLLRTVNFDNRSGSNVSRTYNNVQYVPIQTNQFDAIEIDIRDDTGRRVAFERGKVIITLHFRLRKPAYF
jgi:hypothetical protein